MRGLLELALLIALAEERWRERGAEVRTPSKTTKVVRVADTRIPDTILYEEGAGTLTELVIVSGRKDFTVTAYADGAALVDGTYDDLLLISPSSEWLDAFEEGGNYVVRIAGVSFRESVKVDVRPVNEPFNLRQAVAKLELLKQFLSP